MTCAVSNIEHDGPSVQSERTSDIRTMFVRRSRARATVVYISRDIYVHITYVHMLIYVDLCLFVYMAVCRTLAYMAAARARVMCLWRSVYLRKICIPLCTCM